MLKYTYLRVSLLTLMERKIFDCMTERTARTDLQQRRLGKGSGSRSRGSSVQRQRDTLSETNT